MKFIRRLLMGIVFGIIIGLSAPENIIALMLTIKTIIGEMLSFTIPFIIIFFIASGIATLKQNSAKLLAIASGAAYLSTIAAGLFITAVALLLIDTFQFQGIPPQVQTEITHPLLAFPLPPLMPVSSALFLAFLLGIALTQRKMGCLKQFVDDGKVWVEWIIEHIILPLLPLFVATVFTEITASGNTQQTLSTFGWVLALALIGHWTWLVILYTITGAICKKAPWQAFKAMLPAYITAVGTMSSAATIPVSLKQTKTFLHKKEIADFTVPLCANIHIAGSTITITLCAIAVMVLLPQYSTPTLVGFIPFILALGVIMVAAPGVPGGGVMSALGILTSILHFDQTALGFMIALYVVQDSFGTACNVTGDGAIALIVEKFADEQAVNKLSGEPQSIAYEKDLEEVTQES